MAGRKTSKGAVTTAEIAPQVTNSEAALAAPKAVRKRKSKGSRTRQQLLWSAAASGGTPATGTGTAGIVLAGAYNGLNQFICGMSRAGHTPAQMLKEATILINGFPT